jgi:hypothetical protein
MTINPSSSRILAAVFAILATAALHASWLNAPRSRRHRRNCCRYSLTT